MSGQDLHIHPSQPDDVPAALDALAISSRSDSLSLDLDEILSATCKFAVDLLKVDHSGLVVFDPSYESAQVISEHPPIGTKGLQIPLRGVPTEQLVKLKQPVVVPDISLDNSFSPVNELLRRHGIQSVLIVPLISKGRLLGSLGLDMIGEVRLFTTDEVQLCETFAKQAAAVIELYEQNRQRAEQLAAIQNTVLAVNTKEDLRGVLDTLTSQAVHFLRAKDGGVSQFHLERGELTVIADYKYPHFIGKTIKMDEGLAGHVIRDDLTSKAVEDYNTWSGKAPVFAKTERFGAVLMVNLKWQKQTVGVMYINAERGHEFPNELPPLLSLLAATAAMAMANSRLLEEIELERTRVPGSGRVLQNIADGALEKSGAEWVRLMLIDESGPRRNFVAARDGKLLPTVNRVRPNGMTMNVLKTGRPYRLPNVSKTTESLNPAMIKEGSRAALCLPLSSKGRRLGVIWFHYSKPREFSSDDEEALADYLSQAIVGYDNARQMEQQLEPLWLAAEGVAAAVTTKEVLERIVTNAREFLHADYAILWLYPDADNETPQRLPVWQAITAGVDEALRAGALTEALPIGEITRGAMRKRWISIPDIDEPMAVSLPDIDKPVAASLPEDTLRLLRRLGAKSFEGLGLVVGEEGLGVLYLVYKNRRDSRVDEISRALTFANHAALALKKVKLADQVTKAHRAAQKLTELTSLGDMQKTLDGVVDHTMEVLGCDAVTLFVYDESSDRILPLTTMRGVWQKMRANHCEEAPRDSIVYRMIDYRDGPHYRATDVSEDPLFGNRPFIQREKIKSVCAIPLKVGDTRVGVMFVNYRGDSRHIFTKDELDIITLFANHAAVAIRNNLLYKELEGRLNEQQLLVNLSRELLAADGLEEVLRLVVRCAVDSLKADFVAIVLSDEEGQLKIAGGEGWSEDDVKAYERVKGKKYQTNFTMEQNGPVFITDYFREKRFDVPNIVKSKDIKSGMSVPVSIGGEPVGAMLAHFKEPRTLAELKEWGGPFSLIANLTAASIRQQRTVNTLKAVQLASDEISKIRLGTDQSEVLDKIVEQAVICLPRAFMGTIQLYDEEKNELRFESAYSKEEDTRVLNLVGEKRPLVRRPRRKGSEGRIGIAGRTVIEKTPQLVNDVTLDPDYFEFSPETRSELAVPLLTEDNTVLGVLNVESRRLAAFSKDDEQALLALAKLIVATIQNAKDYRLLENEEQFRQLKETQSLVASLTTLAWLGMASNTWWHSVAGCALDIRSDLKLLRMDLKEHDLGPQLEKLLEDTIVSIDEMVEQILEKPITAQLSYDAAPLDVSVNTLISERVEHLWEDPHYAAVHRVLNLTEQNPRVRCSPEWLSRMVDILIDNAVDAMEGMPDRSLTISTRILDNQVKIAFTDTGPGIPREIKDKLFRQRVDKPADSKSKGLGVGLLIAQAIAQTYRGGARVGRTGPKGTTMYVRLPVLEHD